MAGISTPVPRWTIDASQDDNSASGIEQQCSALSTALPRWNCFERGPRGHIEQQHGSLGKHVLASRLEARKRQPQAACRPVKLEMQHSLPCLCSHSPGKQSSSEETQATITYRSGASNAKLLPDSIGARNAKPLPSPVRFRRSEALCDSLGTADSSTPGSRHLLTHEIGNVTRSASDLFLRRTHLSDVNSSGKRFGAYSANADSFNEKFVPVSSTRRWPTIEGALRLSFSIEQSQQEALLEGAVQSSSSWRGGRVVPLGALPPLESPSQLSVHSELASLACPDNTSRGFQLHDCVDDTDHYCNLAQSQETKIGEAEAAQKSSEQREDQLDDESLRQLPGDERIHDFCHIEKRLKARRPRRRRQLRVAFRRRPRFTRSVRFPRGTRFHLRKRHARKPTLVETASSDEPASLADSSEDEATCTLGSDWERQSISQLALEGEPGDVDLSAWPVDVIEKLASEASFEAVLKHYARAAKWWQVRKHLSSKRRSRMKRASSNS